MERITVRLPEQQIIALNALVERGEYASTSEVVRHAIRDFLKQHGFGVNLANLMVERTKQLSEISENLNKIVEAEVNTNYISGVDGCRLTR
ncbi:MAG: ribbon-helix-helix domain-containing protein [Candidatus Syntropharchaeales archaeon]|nr:ribbon-helix-helix domain-containing protein [Candidatus Syntrophoarchaeum sp.]